MFILGFWFDSHKNDYRMSRFNIIKGNMIISHDMFPFGWWFIFAHVLNYFSIQI